MDDSRPLFAQVAENIENDIISGALPEEGQAPSINEFAAFYRINPATALKGINVLVDAEKLGIDSTQLSHMIAKEANNS